jgi:hypothetical protein
MTRVSSGSNLQPSKNGVMGIARSLLRRERNRVSLPPAPVGIVAGDGENYAPISGS